MLKFKTIAQLLGAVALATTVSAVSVETDAAVPGGVTQQGRLLDSDGMPVTGTIQFLFRIYDLPSGGAVLWEETQDITLDEGYFSARLGDDGANLFPSDLFDGSVRYVGIKVGTDDEMVPRERISSVPYAFEANHADVATNATGDITPNSVTVNGVEIIDSNGDLAGFSRVVQRVNNVGSVSSSGGISSVTASCPANHVVVGGGCDFGNGADGVKYNRPSGTTGYACYAQADAGNTVQSTAYAICLPN